MYTNNNGCIYGWCVDIEWPEDDEALSDDARSTIEALLNNDPRSRPDSLGQAAFLTTAS